MKSDEPTELTLKDINIMVDAMVKSEIKPITCFSCSKPYTHSYGHGWQECDECYFKKWPKEKRDAFFRSFFE